MKNIFVILSSFLLLINNLYADMSDFSRETIKWEKDSLLFTRNTDILPGTHGNPNIVLQPEGYVEDEYTDLIINFEKKSSYIGHYTLVKYPEITNLEPGLGYFSGYFSPTSPKLELKPKKSSLFYKNNYLNDFTIEFWLNPSSMSKKESLFRWNNAYRHEGKIINQFISCTISERKITWDFYNFFNEKDLVNVQLSSYESLIPFKWSHHAVRFNSENGKLEYLKNSIPQDIKFMTKTQKEGGEVFCPKVGEADSTLVFGETFTGKLDEIRIQDKFEKNFLTDKFKSQGFVVLDPFDLKSSDAKLNLLTADIINDKNSEVFAYYRITEDITKMLQWKNTNEFLLDNFLTTSDWIAIPFNEDIITKCDGRYVQLAFNLLPGVRAAYTPKLGETTLYYSSYTKPLPPINLKAFPGDSQVTLTWDEAGDPNVQGYMVYYGTASGYYFGEKASIGNSPADVGNENTIVLKNLENDTLYFFTVVAYDKARVANFSSFASEVIARPAKVYKFLEHKE